MSRPPSKLDALFKALQQGNAAVRKAIVPDFIPQAENGLRKIGEDYGNALAANKVDFKRVTSARPEDQPEREKFIRNFAAIGSLSPEEMAANKAKFLEGSAVKDVVYHGTPDSFDTFSPRESRHDGAYFFTDSPTVAETYAHSAPPKQVRDAQAKLDRRRGALEAIMSREGLPTPFSTEPGHRNYTKIVGKTFDNRPMSAERRRQIDSLIERTDDAGYALDNMDEDAIRRPSIIPAHLSMKNPHVVDATDLPYWQHVMEKALANAKAEGRDGVIVKNVIDNASDSEEKSNVYVAFKPTQIKHATKNRGTFDPTNPNILASVAGAVAALRGGSDGQKK